MSAALTARGGKGLEVWLPLAIASGAAWADVVEASGSAEGMVRQIARLLVERGQLVKKGAGYALAPVKVAAVRGSPLSTTDRAPVRGAPASLSANPKEKACNTTTKAEGPTRASGTGGCETPPSSLGHAASAASTSPSLASASAGASSAPSAGPTTTMGLGSPTVEAVAERQVEAVAPAGAVAVARPELGERYEDYFARIVDEARKFRPCFSFAERNRGCVHDGTGWRMPESIIDVEPESVTVVREPVAEVPLVDLAKASPEERMLRVLDVLDVHGPQRTVSLAELAGLPVKDVHNLLRRAMGVRVNLPVEGVRPPESHRTATRETWWRRPGQAWPWAPTEVTAAGPRFRHRGLRYAVTKLQQLARWDPDAVARLVDHLEGLRDAHREASP